MTATLPSSRDAGSKLMRFQDGLAVEGGGYLGAAAEPAPPVRQQRPLEGGRRPHEVRKPGGVQGIGGRGNFISPGSRTKSCCSVARCPPSSSSWRPISLR